MASERFQRRIERLLDEADEAIARYDWEAVRQAAQAVLAIDPDNSDGQTFLATVERALAGTPNAPSGQPSASTSSTTSTAGSDQPTSFANGRYEVKRFLGEGGKKRVYLAQDTLLDREVAFALIKTEGLDEVSRTRITREAQAMGRLGSHPHIVTVFDLGQEADEPYMVTELIGAADTAMGPQGVGVSLSCLNSRAVRIFIPGRATRGRRRDCSQVSRRGRFWLTTRYPNGSHEKNEREDYYCFNGYWVSAE